MKRDNYLQARDRAQQYFLKQDPEIWRSCPYVQGDAHWLRVQFLNRPYGICRQTGQVLQQWSQEPAGFEETLAIFDLLCHPGEKQLAGSYAPVNSLNGRPVGAGVATDFFSSYAQRIDRDLEGFERACRELGGVPVEMADAAYRFEVFGPLSLIVKVYRSDAEFPASLTVLWDSNTLQYLLYESVFYVEGFLLKELTKDLAMAGNQHRGEEK